MLRTSSDPTTFRRYCGNAQEAVNELTRQSAAGFTCTEMKSLWGNISMTFAPSAPDAPICLYEAMPLEKFWQPEGWDCAYVNASVYYISRPLPPGTTIEEAAYSDVDFTEEQAWLADCAAHGRRLIAVRNDTYYFVPAEPAVVTYTVELGKLFFCGSRPLTPPSPEPDEQGLYFIDMSDTGCIYFADAPSPLPPRKGSFITPEAYRERVSADYRRFERIAKTLFGVLAAILLMVAIGIMVFSPADDMLAVFCVFIGLSCLALGFIPVYLIRRERQKLLDRISTDGEFLKTPPRGIGLSRKRAVSDASLIPSADEATHRKGLNRRRLTYGLVALACSAAVFHLICSMVLRQFSNAFEIMEGVISAIVLAIITVISVSRFRTLTRMLKDRKSEKDE